MQTKEMPRGSASAIEDIARMARGVSYRDMAKVADLAVSAGGALKAVAAAEDDDWCGNGRIHIPWPPKRDEFFRLVDEIVKNRINMEILINGIPVPDELIFNLGSKFGGKLGR